METNKPTNKTVLVAVFNLIAIFTFIYLPLALANEDMSIFNWDESMRGVFLIIGYGFFLIACFIAHKTIVENLKIDLDKARERKVVEVKTQEDWNEFLEKTNDYDSNFVLELFKRVEAKYPCDGSMNYITLVKREQSDDMDIVRGVYHDFHFNKLGTLSEFMKNN